MTRSYNRMEENLLRSVLYLLLKKKKNPNARRYHYFDISRFFYFFLNTHYSYFVLNSFSSIISSAVSVDEI